MSNNPGQISKELSKVNEIRNNNTPMIKNKIIKAINRENNYIPKFYSKIAPKTILDKGQKLLDLLKETPNDFIDIDPFPAFLGYKEEEKEINYFYLIEKDNEWIDEWGTKMSYKSNSVGAAAVDFPIKSWDDFLFYINNNVPKGTNFKRMEKAKNKINKIKNSDEKYIVGKLIFGIFERAQFIRSTENLFLDLYNNEKMVRRLLRELTNYHLSMIEEWSYLNVDAIYYTDDWGGQTNLLISPEQWRKIFKPYYKEIGECIKRNNMNFFFHSCGNIYGIIEDLLEIGVDVLHPIQPKCNDYELIAENYSNEITVMGGIDVQNNLVNGTKDEIKNSIYDFVEVFHKKECGVILSPTNTIVPDTPYENIEYAFNLIRNLKI